MLPRGLPEVRPGPAGGLGGPAVTGCRGPKCLRGASGSGARGRNVTAVADVGLGDQTGRKGGPEAWSSFPRVAHPSEASRARPGAQTAPFASFSPSPEVSREALDVCCRFYNHTICA